MSRKRLPAWIYAKRRLESKPAGAFARRFLESDALTKFYHRRGKAYDRLHAKFGRDPKATSGSRSCATRRMDHDRTQ